MGLIEKYSDLKVAPQPWEQPVIYDLGTTGDQVRVEDELKSGRIAHIIDPFEETANALFEYYHPDRKRNATERTEYIEELAKQDEAFGSWVLFPWDGTLCRYPDQENHFRLRTSRNRDLITFEQQKTLYAKTVMAAGLSVGSAAVHTLVETGIGNTYYLADFDTISPDNLNRIDANQTEVGALKIDEVSKRISKKDPWIKQVLFRDGINEGNLKGIEAQETPDLIVEEVDKMAIKALLRMYARDHKVPLLMAADIDTKSAIDVERYGLNDKRRIMFGGKLSSKEVDELLATDPDFAGNTAKMLKHIGVRNLTTAMLRSSMKRDITLGGLPQLGRTARRGGVNIADAAVEILLGRKMPSGRYIDNPRKTFKLQPLATPLEYIQTVAAVVHYMKGLKSQTE